MEEKRGCFWSFNLIYIYLLFVFQCLYELQIDIREITKEAIELVMATETTMQGMLKTQKYK